MQMLSFIDGLNQLSFDKSPFPAIVVNDGSVTSLEECDAWIRDNKPIIEETLAKAGAVLFRGFPVDSAESFDQFSAAFEYRNFTYKESLSNAVRVNFTERVFTANEAPKDVEIFLHHEMAQTPMAPSKLFFFCQSSAEKGGQTPLCRSDKLYEALNKEWPSAMSAFEEFGVKYTTIMPANDDSESGQGRSWKSTLSVDTEEQAESKLSDLRYTWEWLENGDLKAVTPTLPAVIEFEDESKSFFNQLIAAYMGWKGVKENHSDFIRFGDDSEIPKDILELAAKLAPEYTYDLPWQDGDVALVDNYRAMHGRKPFEGDRKRQVLVALALD
jgi:alpha-ketoglutarate-dependent taurine dioxygenase